MHCCVFRFPTGAAYQKRHTNVIIFKTDALLNHQYIHSMLTCSPIEMVKGEADNLMKQDTDFHNYSQEKKPDTYALLYPTKEEIQ